MTDESQTNNLVPREVIRFLTLRGLTATKILGEMQVYGEHCPSYTTIRRWRLRFVGDPWCSLDDSPRSGRPINRDSIELVREHLGEYPFSSVRVIAAATSIPRATVHSILTEQLGMRKFASRWVPHRLTAEQKQKRVDMSRDLLESLSGMSERQLSNVITEDESWFFLSYAHSGRWATTPEEVEPRERAKIGTPRVMVSVMWGLRGPVVLLGLEVGESFNSSYVKNKLLPALEAKIREDRPVQGLKGIILHWDNARPHTSAMTRGELHDLGIRLLPHPPYSPDIAPSDFFLFGYLKHCLAGRTFRSSAELLEEVKNLMTGIPRSTLLSVISEWKIRLERVITIGGEYYF